MKQVKYLINLIGIPFATLAFITTGLIASFLSALIEYIVVEQFFTSSHLLTIVSSTIAFILVLVFEFSKIYLHFYCMRTKQYPQAGQLASASTHGLLAILAGFSLFCSIVFTTSALYLPGYDQEDIDQQIEEIELHTQANIEKMKAEYEAQYEATIKPYKDNVDNAQAALKEAAGQVSGPQTTTAYMAGLNSTYESASDRYHEAVTLYSSKRDSDIMREQNRLEDEKAQKITTLLDTSDPEIAARYDNRIIARFLTILSNILFHMSTYSRRSYLWLCVLLGILISAVLEIIISLSMQFVGTPMDFLTENLTGVSDKLRAWSHECVITLFKAFCAITVYIIILSIYSGSMEREKICSALFACTLSIFLIQRFLPMPDAKDLKEQVIYKIRDCLLQGVVSLMGFVILGFIFGESAVHLDINTAAIGVGAAISNGITQIPHLLISAKENDQHLTKH